MKVNIQEWCRYHQMPPHPSDLRSYFVVSQMTKPAIACLPVLVGLFLSFSVIAQNQYTIYGTVRGANGLAVPGAVVEISGQSGANIRTFADDLGRYEIAGVMLLGLGNLGTSKCISRYLLLAGVPARFLDFREPPFAAPCL